MSGKLTFRRFVAFIIDILIVSFIVGAFSSLKAINPTLEKYNESYDRYYNYIQDIYLTKDANNIFSDKEALDMSYDVAYYGRYSSIISIVVLVLYFGLFQYYTDGKTVGKLALRIKVSSTKGKLKLQQVLIRSAIINSIFIKIVSIVCLLLMNKDTFNSWNMYLDFVNIGIILVSVVLILYRNDGVGLHDLLGHTKVVRINGESIREANYKES